jgi:hypothetical protein
MKKQVITTTLLLIATIFMASCGNTGNETSNENTTAEMKTAMYQCPMKCEGEKMYEKQGTCPVCKMDLETVSNEIEQSENANNNKPLSPRTSAMAMVGNNHVHIDYGSPSVRERVIWNGLVAYGKVWATGAHKATWIEFSQNVKINNKTIEKGRYGFFTIPDKEEWTVILNKDWDMHMADKYAPENDVIRLSIKPIKTDTLMEALTYEVKILSNEKGLVRMSWEYLMVTFDFENIDL